MMARSAYDFGIPEAGIPALESLSPDEIPAAVNRVIDYVEQVARENGWDLRGRTSPENPVYWLHSYLNDASYMAHLQFPDCSNPFSQESYQKFLGCVERAYELVGEKTRISKRLRMRRQGIDEMFKNITLNREWIHQAISGSQP